MALQTVDIVPKGLSGLCWLNVEARPRFKRRVTHSHPEIEANLIETGTCRYVIDDRVQELGPGDLFWLFPQQEHMIIDASKDMSHWVLLGKPGFLAQRASNVPSSLDQRPQFARPHRLREAERRHLTSVARAIVASEDDPLHHGNGLAWWFSEATRITERRTSDAGRPMHPAIVRALSLLEADPSMPLPELADGVHMSPSRLSHLFAAQVERSVSAHRNQVKLRRFQDHVQGGGFRNLTEAAYLSGFGSYAQFARVLHAQTGLIPSEWLGEA